MIEPELDRWALIKDAIVFQIKLGLDALRDLFLSPVSLILVIFDLSQGRTVKTSLFYRLMVFGHKTDSWINLFGTRRHGEQMPEENADQLFAKIEGIIKEQHSKGGITASAKTTIDRYMDKISGLNSTKPPEEV